MGAPYTAIVLGGFWPQNSVPTLSDIGAWGSGRKEAAYRLSRRSQEVIAAKAVALNGVVAGSNVTVNHSQIQPSTELGGARTVETVALINRNTTAGDVTEINTDVLSYRSRTSFGNSPPANLDGNPLGTR
jgi:hypothetical protein